MKPGYIPKQDRKTLLFLADDCRLPSGIGTMTRELMIGTAHIYNYVQVGGGVNHPDVGRVLDLSQDANREAAIDDASIFLYPYNGYGDPDLIRLLIDKHKVDGIVHFTDPRYFVWLYRMSAELRQKVPIFYYNIWDDLPFPHYNLPYYESCDLLMGISKQTKNINKQVLTYSNTTVPVDLDQPDSRPADSNKRPCNISYVPHGINTKYIYPVTRDHAAVQQLRQKLFGTANPDFVLLHNNRNVRRKMTSDVVLAFREFYLQLTPEQQQGVRLVLHTDPVDENGTDLPTLIRDLASELEDKIVFTHARYSFQDINWLYNACDVVINIASNEGWGLSCTEALMAGVPVINNVTGGLQDQLRFEDAQGRWIEFDEQFASNHNGRYRTHGIWGKAVFPASISIQGSIPTPYIFDDRASILDVAATIKQWYETPTQQRVDAGLEGNRWVCSEEAGMTATAMCDRFAKAINNTFASWTPPNRFQLFNISKQLANSTNKVTGICLQ